MPRRASRRRPGLLEEVTDRGTHLFGELGSSELVAGPGARGGREHLADGDAPRSERRPERSARRDRERDDGEAQRRRQQAPGRVARGGTDPRRRERRDGEVAGPEEGGDVVRSPPDRTELVQPDAGDRQLRYAE